MYRTDVTHRTIQANLVNRRSASYLMMVADRLICNLSETFISKMKINTLSRSVMISRNQQLHIIKRRQIDSKANADICVYRISEGLENIKFIRSPQRNSRVFELICFIPTSNKHILIALKFVNSSTAKSKKDEWWITTAHPYGKKKLKKNLLNGNLIEF